MRHSPAVRLVSLTLVAVVLGACATTETGAPEPSEQPAEERAGQEDSTPLVVRPTADPKEFGGHVTPTEIALPGAGPMIEGDGILTFEALGPAPGTSPELFAAWTELVRSRFLADPTSEQLVELDRRLGEVSVIDATPVFINALLGLDMADPGDIVRAGAITEWWYVAQIRYKQVLLDGDPAALLPRHVRNRMLVVDGWLRMWKRTLKQEDGVERLKAQIEELRANRKAAREQQQREYEEKLRKRAAEKARAETQDSSHVADDEPL